MTWSSRPQPALCRLLLALLWLSWISLGAPLPDVDAYAYDLSLESLRGLRPPVSTRIVHYDFEAEDIHAWKDAEDEYQAVADAIVGLRDQGAQVIVLDLILRQANAEQMKRFWSKVEFTDDLVMGSDWDHQTRGPEGEPLVQGLLFIDASNRKVIRRYRYVYQSDGKTAPSLALAAYLKLRESEFTPNMLGPAGVAIPDLTAGGDAFTRTVPNLVWFDQRSSWSQAGPGNFWHLNPRMLKQWKAQQASANLAGSIVILGYTAPGAGDWGSTPLDPSTPKVLVHSLALNDLLQDSWRVPLGWTQQAASGLLLVLLAWLSLRFSRGLLVIVISLALLIVEPWMLLQTHWIPPLLSWPGFWVLCLAVERWQQLTLHKWRSEHLHTQARLDDPLIMKALAGYQLVDRLGQGGFATVYRGIPLDSLDDAKSVAIKVIHPAIAAGEDYRLRFLREIRITSQLSHPHIVRVLDSGEQDGLLYCVMELLKGKSLKQLLRTPLDLQTGQKVLDPLFQAVDYAHRQGVLHRDLKAENIMLQTDWTELKVVDFGLAFDTDSSQLTKSGELFGSLDYLAPERIQGVNNDPRSDQFALGVVAYELWTGKSPFPSGNTSEVLLFRLTQEAASLQAVRPDLPAELCAAVQRMLARAPEQRFESVGAAREALIRIF